MVLDAPATMAVMENTVVSKEVLSLMFVTE